MIDPRETTIGLDAMRRLSIVAVPLLLVAVACSNGDDGAAATDAPSEPVATEAAPQEAGADEDAPADATDDGAADEGTDAADGGVPVLDFGSGTGSITLLGETHTFDVGPGAGLCRDVFDMIQAGGQVAGDRDIEGAWTIPPLDWASYEDERYDPPSVELEITSTGDDNARWIADAKWAEANDRVGDSQVDSYEKDGLTASGTATFVNAWGSSGGSVEGTWEISCAEE